MQYYKILYRKKELTRRGADVWAAWYRCMGGVVQMYGRRGADVWASWCRCMRGVVQWLEMSSNYIVMAVMVSLC